MLSGVFPDLGTSMMRKVLGCLLQSVFLLGPAVHAASVSPAELGVGSRGSAVLRARTDITKPKWLWKLLLGSIAQAATTYLHFVSFFGLMM